jgi:hypothetical protein
MLETPVYPRVLVAQATVTNLEVRTISRKDRLKDRNPQRLYAEPRLLRMI